MKLVTTVLTIAAAVTVLTLSSCANKKDAYVQPPAPQVVMSK